MKIPEKIYPKIKKNNRSFILLWLIIIIISSLWNFFYFFDLFSHFYLQYLIIWVFFLIFSLLLKDNTSIIICILLIIFLWFNVSKVDFPRKNNLENIDIYYINSNWFVDSPNSIIEDIKKYNPKYLSIVEINNKLHEKIIKELNYKNVSYIDKDVNSIWFYTNEEILLENKYFWEYPFLEIKTEEIHFLVIHPLPPLNKELARKQKINFEEINNVFESINSEKKIVIWDFNSSSFSRVFQKYFWKYNYKPIYSWNTDSIFRIPIDYAISNTDFLNIYWWNLKVSDHIPLLIEQKKESF
jgi:hypothetical protein